MPTPSAPLPPLLLRLVYACYAWPVFLLLAIASLPVLLLLPGLPRRRRLIRGVAATALRCIGMRISATGIDTLPHPCVVVANHESYLDGVVLAATHPEPGVHRAVDHCRMEREGRSASPAICVVRA